MTPYFSRNGIAIYHGDCRDVLPGLGADVILADPPYGINHPTNYAGRKRGALAPCRDYPAVVGDAAPFDPRWILALGKPTALWGGNYFADHLPPSSGWLVWDKLRPHTLDQATAELAWTNFVKGTRVFRYLWNGMIRAGDDVLSHPTQKPVALAEWTLSLKWTPPGTVVDPYMGTGATLVAAQKVGRRAIGIEIEERYCEIAARRLDQLALPFEVLVTRQPTKVGVDLE